nr:ATP-grasp domain-containing protein [Methanobrevibacter arboriphilus]
MVNNNSVNSVLVFEYYTASGKNDPTIISEAKCLIDSLLNDLSSFSEDNDTKIHFLVANDFKYIGDNYNYINENKIIIDVPLEDWLKSNIDKFDSCMFISAEENMNLYNLAKLIEDKGVKIYGSDSNSTLICSNKFLTFKHLQSIVKQPKTFQFTISDEISWEESIKDIFKSLKSSNDSKIGDNEYSKNSKINDINKFSNYSKNSDINKYSNDFRTRSSNDYKLIVKPIYGVDCQDMVIISEIEDINNIKNVFPNNTQVLVQEYIHGDNFSVSLISDGKKAIPISFNKQYIDINKENQSYIGGELPFNHPDLESAFLIAKKAVESIEGIKGFVGVDLIITDDYSAGNNSIYFLEINSRFTTPYVGLSKIAKFNIGKSIINLLDNKIDISKLYKEGFGSNKFDKMVKFKKNGNNLDIEVL